MALELVDQPEGGKIAVNRPKATVTVQDDCATGTKTGSEIEGSLWS
jgi:hypothetical protein